MNWRRWLLPVGLLILAGDLLWTIYARWGLITVHARNVPLSEVTRSIERQGGVILRSDLDPSTKVSMNVTRVTLGEALETLATVTDSRWRLAYVVAPTRGEISNLLARFSSGEPLEGWKTLYVPLVLPVGAEPLSPPDPRRDLWNVQPPPEKTVQAFLDQGSKTVSASFLFPATWNPAIASTPNSGPVRKVVPKLAKLAHGDEEEVFLLMKPRRREGGGGPPPEEGNRDWMGNREAIEARTKAEIAKLPAPQRAAAEAEMAERRDFFQTVQALSPADRRARMEEYMQQPKIQDQMDQRFQGREARMTPEQRVQRAQSYAQRRQELRSQ